jgi:ABC-type transporter Mla MlaB component
MTGDCALYDDGVLRITSTDDPPGLAIAGEIDESTYPGLIGVLDKLADTPAEIHVSLAGVSYCDLAGLRAIVRITGAESNGADRNRDGSRRVVHGVSRPIKTVLQIVGWDSIPGLDLDQPDSSVPPGSAGGSGSHGSHGQGSVVW